MSGIRLTFPLAIIFLKEVLTIWKQTRKEIFFPLSVKGKKISLRLVSH